MNCPKCGMTLELKRGRWHCPRCDFWKESYGEADWRKHGDNVRALLGRLRGRFPQVTWTMGLGAESDLRLDIPPQRKGEPDISGWWMRRHFISIEVSGTDSPKVSVPPDPILVRPGKLLEDGIPCFFYMVYRTSTLVVPDAAVTKHRRNITTRRRKGKHETFISVPCSEGLESSALFVFISKQLHQFEPRISLEEQRR